VLALPQRIGEETPEKLDSACRRCLYMPLQNGRAIAFMAASTSTFPQLISVAKIVKQKNRLMI